MDTEDRPEDLVTERRSREDAEDLAVALPRLERYRKEQARLVEHEDLMRDLELDVE